MYSVYIWTLDGPWTPDPGCSHQGATARIGANATEAGHAGNIFGSELVRMFEASIARFSLGFCYISIHWRFSRTSYIETSDLNYMEN